MRKLKTADRWIGMVLTPALLILLVTACKPPAKPQSARAIKEAVRIARPLQEHEVALLEPVQELYPDFIFPASAWNQPDSQKVTLVYPQPPDSLFSAIDYQVQIDPRQPIVFYDFSLMEGWDGRGLFLVQTDHVARSETSCNKKECIQNFWLDGELVDTRTEENYGQLLQPLTEATQDAQATLPVVY